MATLSWGSVLKKNYVNLNMTYSVHVHIVPSFFREVLLRMMTSDDEMTRTARGFVYQIDGWHKVCVMVDFNNGE
mgnify:FL=1